VPARRSRAPAGLPSPPEPGAAGLPGPPQASKCDPPFSPTGKPRFHYSLRRINAEARVSLRQCLISSRSMSPLLWLVRSK